MKSNKYFFPYMLASAKPKETIHPLKDHKREPRKIISSEGP